MRTCTIRTCLIIAVAFASPAVVALLSPPPFVASQSPRILVYDNFVSAAECATLKNGGYGSKDVELAMAAVGSRIGALTSAPHFGEQSPNVLHIRSDDPPGRLFVLHEDTNGGMHFRFATAICYFSDVPEECGGATSFPLADAADSDPVLAAACLLMDANIRHLKDAKTSMEMEAASLLRHASDDCTILRSRGVKVQPAAGRLCLFFGRDAHGEVDARSWHRGDPIVSSPDEAAHKAMAVFFKEIPQGQFDSRASFEAAVASVRSLSDQ
mmetsp:Transcript_71886/g.144661  ORF Transcript_71886/g.144661 Transcript_71886/m.144661 type:complete len:269 (-) Transcript_71886:126-932(-)